MIKPLFFFDNVLDRGELSASSTATGYDVLNVTDWRPYTRWRPDTMSAYIHADCGSAQPADSLFIAGHSLWSSGVTVTVLAGATSVIGAATTLATVVPDSDRALMAKFNSVSARHWFVLFEGGGSPELIPEMGIVAVGAAFEGERGLQYGFDPFGRDLKGSFNTAVEGDPLGRVLDYEQFKESLQFNLITVDWLRDSFIPAWNTHLKLKPWGFCPDPDNNPGECFLVGTTGGFKAAPRTPALVDLSFEVMGKFEG